MRGEKRAKPVSGHKCAGAQVAVVVRCECGWRSAHFYGEGARGNAYAEWRWHVDQHAPRAVDVAPTSTHQSTRLP